MKISQSTVKMVLLAILSAIILLMAFTPLGYLKIGVFSITFLMVPVVIGAIVLGPGAGAFLGGVFGLTSFIQCFGLDPFGAQLLSINPVYTFILTMVPRVLAGWIPGLIFKLLKKFSEGHNSSHNSNHGKSIKGIIPYGAASISGSILNTVFFMTFFVLLFGSTDLFKEIQGGKSILVFVASLVGLNGIIEAIACCILGAAISRALVRYREI